MSRPAKQMSSELFTIDPVIGSYTLSVLSLALDPFTPLSRAMAGEGSAARPAAAAGVGSLFRAR